MRVCSEGLRPAMALFWLLACSFVAFGFFVYLYGCNIVNRFQHKHLPGPRPSWLVGNGRRGCGSPHQLGPAGKSFLALERWARTYGPCYVMCLGRQPLVVLSDPDLIREVGMRRFSTFHDRPTGSLRTGAAVDMEFQRRGLLGATGKFWSGVRAACEPLFHTTALAGYAPTMNKAIDRLEEKLGAACSSEVGVDMSAVLAGLTMDVIGSTAFGVDFHAQTAGDDPNPLLEASKVFFQPFGAMNPLLFLAFSGVPHLGRLLGWLAVRLRVARIVALAKARALVWGATQQLLDNARAAASPGDPTGGPRQGQTAAQGGAEGGNAHNTYNPYGPCPLAVPPEGGAVRGAGGSRVLLAEEQAAEFQRGREMQRGAVPSSTSIVHMLRIAKNAETSAPLTDMEICSQLFTFLLAGYETTSLALGYALYELAKQPALQARIAAEVAALGLAEGAPIEYAHLARLPLTEAAFNESMRLYPPASAFVALIREAREATQLGQFSIPKGSHVMFNVFALHRDPRHYPNPTEFRPERFLPGSEEAAQRHPWAYIPFGLGPRKCIGYKFAMEEGVLALARLLRHFEVSLDTEHHKPGEPLDLVAGVTLIPRGGIWLCFRRRE